MPYASTVSRRYRLKRYARRRKAITGTVRSLITYGRKRAPKNYGGMLAYRGVKQYNFRTAWKRAVKKSRGWFRRYR